MELISDCFSMRAQSNGTTVSLIFSIKDRDFFSGYIENWVTDFKNVRKHPHIQEIITNPFEVIMVIQSRAITKSYFLQIFNLWIAREIKFFLNRSHAA